MKHASRGAAAVVACLTLAGCGGASDASASGTETSSPTATTTQATTSAPTTSTSAPTTTTATRTTSSGPSYNARHNIEKQLGERAALVDENGAPLVTFSVDRIRVDPRCDGVNSKSLNGHYVVLDMHLKVDPSFTEGVFLRVKDFAIVGANGVTDTNVAGYGWDCMRNDISQQQLGPGEYQGSVVLDAAETSGNVIFRPPALGIDSGWEWQF